MNKRQLGKTGVTVPHRVTPQGASARWPRLGLASLGALVVVLAAGAARADCNDPFGKPGEALDFHFKLTRADWNALLASKVPSTDGNRAACDANYPEFQAEFRCGTEMPWLKIAIRKKRGEERGVEAPQKPPLKIDINEDFMGKVPTAKGQRWPAGFGELGYRKLTLNNGQGNKPPGRSLVLPNLLSEHVALRLLHREVPSAPGTAIAYVTLHFAEDPSSSEFHGAYLLVEDIDKTALKRRFGRGDGRLVKASKAGCPIEVQYDDGPPNAAKAAYDAFIAKSPTSLADADKGLDLDTVLRQEAIREILVNGDDTLMYGGGEGNNWYSYDPREGLRVYMPWDVDLTFGQQQQNCAPNALKCPATFPLQRFCKGSRLGQATACNPPVQKRYLEIMCQLTQGSLSADEIIKVWDEADKVTRPGVAREKDLIWRGMDPLSTSIDKSYGAEYVRLRAWIPERIKSVQAQLTAKGVACAPGCPAGAVQACQYLTCAGERRCENNLWTPCQPKPGCAQAATPGMMAGGDKPGADAGMSGPDGAGGATGAGGGGSGPPGSGSGASSGSSGSGSAGSGSSPGSGSSSGAGAGDPDGASRGGNGGGSAARNGGRSGSNEPAKPSPSAPGGCSFAKASGSAQAAGLWALALILATRARRRR